MLFDTIIDEDLAEIYSRNYSWEKFQSSNILITGSYGMLASYLVFFFIYLNEVYNYNISLYCQGRSVDKMRNRFGRYINKSYFHDIYKELDSEFSIDVNLDYVIHAASLANPSHYAIRPIEVEEPNVIGTYFLLKMCDTMKIKKFLFFSSGDVYGEMDKDVENITENMYGAVNQLDVHSCYGESKRMGETWCVSFFRERKVSTVIARIGHTYGPTMDIENDPRVFSAFVRNVINQDDIVMMSDGTSRRPFCYIADSTAAFLLLLIKGAEGEAYNVCNTKQFVSIGELADTLVDISKNKTKVIKKERSEGDKYVEATFNKANKPIENKLMNIGWECKYSVQEGFERVIRYYDTER